LPEVGSESLTATPVAVPAPLLLAVITNSATSPALIGLFDAVFEIETLGQFTPIVAVLLLSFVFDSLPAATVAVLLSGPQVTAPFTPIALPVTVIVNVFGDVTLPKLQLSWFTTTPQAVAADGSLVTTHCELFAGNVSEAVTLYAVPAPLTVTWIWNEIVSPALTGSACPGAFVFETVTFGQFTTMEVALWPLPSFVVATAAVLFSVPHVATVVGDEMWTLFEAPEASVPKVQVSVLPEIVQSPLSGDSVQVSPDADGSESVMVTPYADPVPLFVAVMVKPTPSVAFTGVASGVFKTLMSAQFTAMSARELLLPVFASFDAPTTTEFRSRPQFAFAVGPVTWTVLVPPAAMFGQSQSRLPERMVQFALSSLQVTPEGSRSVSVTFFAVPVPLFVTTIVNAAVSPALIVPLSAVFSTTRSGQFTVTWAVTLGIAFAWFETTAETVFETVPQAAGVVVPTMCTESDPPFAARSVVPEGGHFSAPPLIAQFGFAGEIDQLTFAGRLSVRAKPWAMPAPLLVAVMVKPI
jgi:hypothetical protein